MPYKWTAEQLAKRRGEKGRRGVRPHYDGPRLLDLFREEIATGEPFTRGQMFQRLLQRRPELEKEIKCVLGSMTTQLLEQKELQVIGRASRGMIYQLNGNKVK